MDFYDFIDNNPPIRNRHIPDKKNKFLKDKKNQHKYVQLKLMRKKNDFDRRLSKSDYLGMQLNYLKKQLIIYDLLFSHLKSIHC